MDCGGCKNLKCASRITIWAMGSCSDDDAKKWMMSHGLVYGKVSCAKGHDEEECIMEGEKWHCPKRTCRGAYPVLGPFLGGNKKLPALRVIAIIYGWVTGLSRATISKKNRDNPQIGWAIHAAD